MLQNPDGTGEVPSDQINEDYDGVGGFSEPASPPDAVLRRLRSVAVRHESSLASVCTVDAAALSPAAAGGGPPTSGKDRQSRQRGDDGNNNSVLATLSLRRSLCPQPPLDSALPGKGGGSSAAARDGLVVELDLNPPERVPPHRIVPGLGNPADGTGSGGGPIMPEEDMDGLGGGGGGSSFAARKAIAALAALCDEARELETLADRRLLPPLALFGSDLRRTAHDTMNGGVAGPSAGGGGGGGAAVGMDDMDEVATARRDAELLRRVGKFVPALQETFNFTLRCRRLVRNMVCQIGGCASPAAADGGMDDDDAAAGDAAVRENGTGGPATSEASATVDHSAVFGPEVHLLPLAEAVSRLLRILIAVDAVVARNAPLREGWDLYKAVITDRAVKLQTEGRRDETLESFERLLVQLDFTLLSSRSFVTAIEQNFDPGSHYRVELGRGPSGGEKAAEGFTLYGEVKALLAALYGRCCERIGTGVESDERDVAVGVYGLYCLYRRLLPSHVIPDARLHKSLWTDLPARCPVMALFCDAPFRPREFMLRYAPYEGLRGCSPSSDPAELRADATDRLTKEAASLSAVVAALHSDAVRWLAAADSDLAPPPPSGAGRATSPEEDPALTVERSVAQILRGVTLARRSSALLRNYLVSYGALDLPVEASHVSSLMSLCEVIKSVEKMLRVRRRAAVVCIQRAAFKMVAASIYRRFEPLRLATDQYHASVEPPDTLASTGKIARISACLSSLEAILKGSSTFSPARRYAVEIAVCACTVGGDDFHFEIPSGTETLLEHLGFLSDMDDHLQRACDCSFLYFHKDLFASFVHEIYRTCLKIERIQLICSAFSDAEDEFLHLAPPERNEGLLCADTYRDFLCSVLHEEVIVPLCQTIETELRLAVYTKSLEQMKRSNPKLDSSPKIGQFLDITTLSICGKSINFKREVEEYLDNVFYIMSCVSLNESRTYAEMRILAQSFGLELLDNCLPLGNFGQGVDILHILRNMDGIVSRYNYDLNQDILIERRPYRDAKYIRTITTQCVSASLRQHGLGTIGNAVESACTLLSVKLKSVSQFCLNDYFCSLLSKEVRWLREHREECGGAYPFDRAVQFSQEIGKLGNDDDGKPLLDQLRILTTEIGNALGLVRMVWSAEMQICSEKLEPVLASSDVEVSVDPDALLASGIRKAALNMAAAVSKPASSFERKPPIRHILSTFKQKMPSEDYAHLNCFYAAIPALCICWMEASLQGKEMMHKKNITRDVYYTDDGFAMGIAFLLSLYEQDETFDAMKWFTSVKQKIAADESILADQKAAHDAKKDPAQSNQKGGMFSFSRSVGGDMMLDEDDDELTSLTLIGKKLEARKRESKVIFCSIHCARILLKE